MKLSRRLVTASPCPSAAGGDRGEPVTVTVRQIGPEPALTKRAAANWPTDQRGAPPAAARGAAPAAMMRIGPDTLNMAVAALSRWASSWVLRLSTSFTDPARRPCRLWAISVSPA